MLLLSLPSCQSSDGSEGSSSGGASGARWWQAGAARALVNVLVARPADAAHGAATLLNGAAAAVRGVCAAMTAALRLRMAAPAAPPPADAPPSRYGGLLDLISPEKPLHVWCDDYCQREELVEAAKHGGVSAPCELHGGSIGAFSLAPALRRQRLSSVDPPAGAAAPDANNSVGMAHLFSNTACICSLCQ